MNRIDFIGSSRHSYSRIAENGTYYFPAWKHYNRVANVICDRCYKNDLKACIGYGEQDLCLQCADQITNNVVSTCGCGMSTVHHHHDIYVEDNRNKSISDVCDEVRIVKK